jgi:hypothetical protein
MQEGADPLGLDNVKAGLVAARATAIGRHAASRSPLRPVTDGLWVTKATEVRQVLEVTSQL